MNNTHLHIDQILTKLDSFSLYNTLETNKDIFLLDSSKLESPYSSYSIFGANPFLTVKYIHGKIYIKYYKHDTDSFKLLDETDIFAYLNAVIHTYQTVNETDLPFIGGGIGYFNYDLSKELETLPTTTTKHSDIPDAYFVFYDNAIIHDLKTGIVHITGLGILDDSINSVNHIKALLSNAQAFDLKAYDLKAYDLKSSDLKAYDPKSTMNSRAFESKPVFKSTFTKQAYIDAVEATRQYIENGHIYISNMTHTFSSKFEKDPYLTYERLRRINPAPFSAYLPGHDFTILSSSPERFLKIQNGFVQTRPIKGTTPRGNTPEEDLKNKLQLENSEKDNSELLMIVDLERNDLSKVCKPGSVKVTELFKTETYATVFHLVSTIEGELLDNNTSIDCIKGTFPGGSITGAPKIRAMEIIDELEHNNRGLYTGSIGYIGFDGNADLNIVIRTILLHNNHGYIGVGGGITWESDPASEYQETIDKAVALFKALDSDYEV